MTITANDRRKDYLGNGVATVFAGPRAFSKSHVQVYVGSAESIALVPDSQYEVTGVAGRATTITFATAPASGASIIILRTMPLDQPTDITNQGAFLPEIHEDAFDYRVMQIQQLADAVARSLRLPDSFAGVVPNLFVNPEQGKFLYWGPDGISNADISGPGDLALRSDLQAVGGGANLVRYSAGETVRQALDRLGGRNKTVDDYGAKTDGSNAAAAFQAMAADTGGVIVMGQGEYYVGNLVLPTYDNLIIVGAGQPLPSAGHTRSYGGSILIGGLNARASRARLADFGADLGTGRGYDTTVGIDGIVINTPVGLGGSYCAIDNVTSIGPGESGSSHRILVQGFSDGHARNCIVSEGQYGLVPKCRNFNIDTVMATFVRTAGVYPKSDVPASGGDVGDSSASNINVSNVIVTCRPTNAECAGVYVHASTLPIAKVNVTNVYQLYGHSPLRFQGPGTIEAPAASGMTGANILSEGAQYGFFAGGYCYDWRVENVHAINPKTGRLWYMDTSTSWRISNSGVLITDAALGTVLGNAAGSGGQMEGIYVRRTDQQMTITISAVPSAIKQFHTGHLSGNVRYSMDQALAGQNGSVADTGRPPTFKLIPGGKAQLGGRFSLSGASNKFFCNLPVTTGLEYAFPAVYLDGSSAFQPCVIRLNSFQLSMEPAMPAGALFIYLDNLELTF